MKSYSRVSVAAGLSRTEGHGLQSGPSAAPPGKPFCPGYTVWCEDVDEIMSHSYKHGAFTENLFNDAPQDGSRVKLIVTSYC